MARYLVDTTVLIDLSKGVRGVRSRLDALVDCGDELGLCAVNVAEFFAGVPAAQRARWEEWLVALKYWEITREAAIQAGVYRETHARLGQTVHTPDALVAAVAKLLDATILTDNVKDFPMADVAALSLRT